MGSIVAFAHAHRDRPSRHAACCRSLQRGASRRPAKTSRREQQSVSARHASCVRLPHAFMPRTVTEEKANVPSSQFAAGVLRPFGRRPGTVRRSDRERTKRSSNPRNRREFRARQVAAECDRELAQGNRACSPAQRALPKESRTSEAAEDEKQETCFPSTPSSRNKRQVCCRTGAKSRKRQHQRFPPARYVSQRYRRQKHTRRMRNQQ